ncbi:MAG: hypothetical protein V3573_12800 [Desulfovibrionaceae bacterium]
MNCRSKPVWLFFLLGLVVICTAGPGCSMVPTWVGGDPGPSEVQADGEQEFTESVTLGEILVLDMRDPGLSGYEFAGVVFDPAMFRLDTVLEEDSRARYEFTALAVGESVVEVRIKSRSDSLVEIYKRITVTVEK